MKAFVQDNNLSASVIFHGKKSVDEITNFYHSCGVMLFTSKMEGYPMVVLESKAYGIPLVMYDMPYLSLTKDGLGILTAPLGNIEAMAENIKSLLTNNTLYTRMAQEARQSFDSLLSINHEKVWDNIIAIACGGQEIQEEQYFRAENMNDTDRNIMPVLFENIKRGYDNAFGNSIEYRVGIKVMKYPRIFKHLIRRLLAF